ncbi:hypothetical protein [Rhodovastum atsumiense]|uniref:OmpA family protein n=2 Tax=Rhodovastum atsumiense TaxID=504468 RepID=A0A5M6ISX7_9PROT|nr:hypothetical protein [Rhodovastum atsumiense]KAA5610999.1 hypothetical protein F1189_16440 [Rhodovastum atsumiense]
MRASLLVLSLLLTGCELVDQRTVARWFGSPRQAPSEADLAGATLPERPLVTIRFDTPDIDYRPVLAEAAQAALARKQDAVFDVVTPVPSAQPAAAQDAFVRRGTADARAVADALATEGVPPGQIRLGLRGDPGSPAREVRVYVR